MGGRRVNIYTKHWIWKLMIMVHFLAIGAQHISRKEFQMSNEVKPYELKRPNYSFFIRFGHTWGT